MSLMVKSIGQAAAELQISAHTLRYYEKIGLISKVSKSQSGRRQYYNGDIDRVRFIKRAQRMRFSLSEIRTLIQLDMAIEIDKPQVQALVKEKLVDIEVSLKEIKQLKYDLGGLLEACKDSTTDEECPIIVGLKKE